MTTVLLDTHVVVWWTQDPGRLSPVAAAALEDADELAVADISWYELAWLATHGRISLDLPLRTWLGELAAQLRTAPVTPDVAAAAVDLPSSFPGDPADRLIFATAVTRGWSLVTKDRRMHEHPHPRAVAVW